MAISGFRHIPCGTPVNASEQLAIEKLRTKLQSTAGPWILLSNLSHSPGAGRLSDEIDQVVIGPSGVFVIEVKHWDALFLKQRSHVVESEADRVNDKAKRIAGKLKSAFDPGFVAPRLLLTRSNYAGIQANQRIRMRGVPMFGLNEWKDLIDVEHCSRLDAIRIEEAARLLVPTSRIVLTGELRSFAGLINLERLSPPEESFHRIYRGQHPTRRDRVILHIYDLSAADEKDPKNRAEREYQVIQRWQKSPCLPNLLDSFQEAEHYPGELYYFSLVDPAAPSLIERSQDSNWNLDDRLHFARNALLALAGFHHPPEDGLQPLVHRHITPHTLRVRHDGRPLFTDFSLARLSDAPTISAATPDFGDDALYVAPEVRSGGLTAADARSDVFALCKTLIELFTDDTPKAAEVRAFLEQGCAINPENRESLRELAAVMERNTTPPTVSSPPLPAPNFWDEDTIVPFQNSRYKIVGRLGGGGIGETFKVVEVSKSSEELYGTYVAKLIYRQIDADGALRAYRKARAYTIHPHLSAIHEYAPEWHADRFVVLLKWVEGIPLSDLTGVLSLYAGELGEASLQTLMLRWLRDVCDALWQFHRVGLVHGDVSPKNIIVQGGELVLTDYDTVTDSGEVPRHRNVLYASQSVENLTAIHPADDVFALAASAFHVLFDREPFLFSAERSKTRGLNREGLNTDGLETVVTFLDRATAPDAVDRFADARAALTFLAVATDAANGLQEPSPSPVLKNQIARRLTELLMAYPGSHHGNVETRGLDSEFAESTYVETRLDTTLKDDIETNKVNLVILFGNAGDGKTAFLQHLLQELGAIDVRSSHRLLERRLPDGRILRVNLDGSAALHGKSANMLLDEFLKPFQDMEFTGSARHPRILAINNGKLLEWLDDRDETPLAGHLYTALFDNDGDEAPILDSRIRLIDLNCRSLVGGIENSRIHSGFLDALLDRFLGIDLRADPWQPCVTCTAQDRCTAYHSVQNLRDETRGPRLRRRLADALQACHLRGEIHITARELRAALVFIFFGVHDCAELHATPELVPRRYWDRAFDAQAPQRQGDLLNELARFDPALDCNPPLDRDLLKTKPHAAKNAATARATARRRAWFEWGEAEFAATTLGMDALPLFGAPYLDRFRSVPLMEEGERAALCRELCEGIARLEDLPQAAFDRNDGLPLRITPRTPTESAFWVVKAWERFRLVVPLSRRTEDLETLHTHLLLVYRYATDEDERLPISLELFHLLLALRDGAQLSGTGQEGIFAHLEIFTQRLAQENARELYGWHPGDESTAFRVYIETLNGRQVLTRDVV
ncbi:NERD domain-containing protein kinase family protein [Accumulibacter sp.]|uniref:NERD domain-containing protein kinase family protein n=1 Tax=Accumulibacter sp. TaxID=2053492 RepID=UPI002BEB1E66|nr:NERD domain-containing protein kinase family protein [Accumulibacter sp.]HNH92631.1 NERD domain-containing protein kinase family protein [Accumulibacter sp.]